MLELVVLSPAFGMRNVSPYCVKAEMLLKSLALPFKLTEESDPRKAPKGKLPYLIADGEQIADSELITDYLNKKTDGAVYKDLTPLQSAQGLAIARLCEDHLYWLMVASRWLDDAWWPNVVEGFFQAAPKLVRGLVSNGARKQVRQTLALHGLGKHNLAEQKGFAQRDMQALNDLVPSEGFLFGATPNIYDFIVAGTMCGIFDNQPGTWLTALAQPYENLQRYTERVQETMGVYGRTT